VLLRLDIKADSFVDRSDRGDQLHRGAWDLPNAKTASGGNDGDGRGTVIAKHHQRKLARHARRWRTAAYESIRVIADKHDVDRIQMFHREGQLVFSTDTREKPIAANTGNEICVSCHSATPMMTSRP
jgi:hypothetical protein